MFEQIRWSQAGGFQAWEKWCLLSLTAVYPSSRVLIPISNIPVTNECLGEPHLHWEHFLFASQGSYKKEEYGETLSMSRHPFSIQLMSRLNGSLLDSFPSYGYTKSVRGVHQKERLQDVVFVHALFLPNPRLPICFAVVLYSIFGVLTLLGDLRTLGDTSPPYNTYSARGMYFILMCFVIFVLKIPVDVSNSVP